MISNPEKTISIYDLPLICSTAWDRAATPVNIKSGFLSSGILPLDRSIFSDQDFLCSALTGRSLARNNKEQRENFPEKISQTASISIPTSVASPNLGKLTQDAQNQTKETRFLSPECIRPYPAAPFRDKTSKKKRKKSRTMIATDTPEKNRIEQENALTANKPSGLNGKKVVRKHFSLISDPALYEKTGHNEPLIVNSSNELNGPHCSYSETATNKSRAGQNMEQSVQRKSKSSKSRARLFPECTFSSSESDAENDVSDSSKFDESDGEIIEGDFVVVKVKGQSRFLNYIARVDTIVNLECKGVFLRRIPVCIAEGLPTFLLTQWMKLPDHAMTM